MARHRDRTSDWLWVLPALLIPVIVAAVAWTAHVASEGDAVAPNVRFAGLDISGMTPRDVAAHIAEREQELLNTPVIVDLGERRVVMTAEEVGYDYLYNETVLDVVSARHSSGPWDEFVAWATIPFSTVTVEDSYALDDEAALKRITQPDFVLSDPVEPTLALDDDGTLYAESGVNGVGVDIDRLLADLSDADVASGAVEVTARRVSVPPTVSDGIAAQVASTTNHLTARGFLAVAANQSALLSPSQVRRHLVSTAEDGEMTISVDLKGFHAQVEAAFPETLGEISPPELEVAGGRVEVVSEGRPPPVCCEEDTVMSAAESLMSGGQSWHRLEVRPSEDETLVAWSKGTHVVEPVAEFTTFHACCENRVVNIQTIADALTGKYLIPGETLSLNDYVGPRTREKGYLPAGAIRGGHMTDEVGGGVSQFVTTIFNAAFFAGLDLDEYRSHSVYFSRYPFGREATLSIPGPDLVMTNNTDYPVLIWPTYTDSSITVTIYSTRNVEVVELQQRISYRNACRHSEIDRQRTFSDGSVEIDTIVADYRPGDGIDCYGNPIPER